MTLPKNTEMQEDVIEQNQENSIHTDEDHEEIDDKQAEFKGYQEKQQGKEDSGEDCDGAESDNDYFEKDVTIDAERIVFEEGLDDCFNQWMNKV